MDMLRRAELGCSRLWPVLAREMTEMRVKIAPSGNEQYGAWREGEHDDLALAVALACWRARKARPNPPYGEEGYWRRPAGQVPFRSGGGNIM